MKAIDLNKKTKRKEFEMFNLIPREYKFPKPLTCMEGTYIKLTSYSLLLEDHFTISLINV